MVRKPNHKGFTVFAKYGYKAQCQNCPTVIQAGEPRLRYHNGLDFSAKVSKSLCKECAKQLLVELEILVTNWEAKLQVLRHF